MGHTVAKAVSSPSIQSPLKTRQRNTTFSNNLLEEPLSRPSVYSTSRVDLIPLDAERIQPIYKKRAEEVDPRERYRILLGANQVSMVDSIDIFNTIVDSDVPSYGVIPPEIHTSNLASLCAMDIGAPSMFHLSVAQELLNRRLPENWSIRAIASYHRQIRKEKTTLISAVFEPNHTRVLLEKLDTLYPDSLAAILLARGENLE